MHVTVKERNEIDDAYKWDLTVIYSSIDEWNNDFERLEREIKNFSKYEGKISLGSNTLLESLQMRDKLFLVYERLSSYAMRKSDEDTRNNDNLKLKNKINSLGTEISEITSFFEPEITMIGRNKILSFVNENEDLKVYKHYLETVLRYEKHILSPNEEKIIASASEVISSPSNVYSVLSNADIKFGNIEDENNKSVELTKGNYTKYITSQNREVRKSAFFTLYRSYSVLKNTFAETLIGDIKANYFISKNKKYNDPLDMALFHNHITPIVYENVINAVNNNMDKMHKYVDMKKRILKFENFHIYDFYVDLVKEYDVEYKYEEAVELVFKALKPLGEEYIKNAKRVFNERWIDVYENKGKKSGAYSSHGYDTPPYILLNYNGRLDNVGTLIHELGHSMHSYYSASKQPYIYHGYSIFVAEVASNVNEMLLNMYMLDNAKCKEERLSLINDFLESVKGSIYRQTMFAEFEKEIYDIEGRKEPLTEDVISKIYYDLNKKYYGDNITIDDEIRYEWMRIPHFYYQFYVYQYATGLTAAFNIARRLYTAEEGFLDKYLNFLSSGSSDYPLELLKKLDINMESEEPINSILKYFDEQIDKFIMEA